MASEFKAKPYQEIIMRAIQGRKRGAVWSPPGTGKTVSTLTAWEDLSLVEDVYPALVIAPKRVARDVWSDEVHKWNHLKHLKVSQILGNVKERTAALRVQADIYTVNYEQLPWLVEYWGDRWPYKRVAADEASKLKGFRLRQGTTRAKALARVAHTKIKSITLLTGTPSSNGLQDLWGQMWFVDKGDRLGRTMEAFKDRWFHPNYNGFGVEANDYAQVQIQDALADVCVTIDASDWFDLEAPVLNRVYLNMPVSARVLYTEMEKKFFMELEGSKIEAVSAAAKSMKLLQITNGAAYLEDGKAWKKIHDEKLDALEEIIEEACGMPVLVAYHFKSDLARLKERFKDGLDLSTVDGMERAKRGEGRVWFGHPDSIGHGVDGLHYHTNIMVFFCVNWNLENHLQIIDRIGPVRQLQAGFKRPVFIHYLLMQNTIDEIVLERITSKRSVQDILLAAMKLRNEG